MTKQTTSSPGSNRVFTGEVVSSSMDKTLVVRVARTLTHPKYGKRYVRSHKFHVHDEKNEHVVGDKVSFVECRPMSKTKRWRVINSAA